MDHSSLVTRISALPFVTDRHMAETALTVVLGLLAEKLPSEDGSALRDELPEALAEERLATVRGQWTPVPGTASSYVDWIRRKFDLDGDEAHDLIYAVRDGLREAEPARFEEIREVLPADWRRLLDGA
jgi:uncharacterized protein (DUF2267 family)